MRTTGALALAPDLAQDRTVIYGRQSKDKKISITNQLSIGQDRAADEGWTVVAILQEGRGASRHTKGKGREAWPQVIEMVEGGQVDRVWLWESSRGDRKLTSWSALLDACQANQVTIWIEDDERDYNMNVTRDWKTLANAGVESQGETDLTTDRTMRAKNKARREGNLRRVVGGPPPVGYQDGPEDWQADPAHARVLADVAARVIAGESLTEAYRVQPPIYTAAKGKAASHRVTEKAMRAALQRPATAGLMTDPDGTVIGQVIESPPLDPAVWAEVRDIFQGRKRGRATTGAYPLGPVLVCGACGNQLTGSKSYYRGKQTPTYACRTPHKAGDKIVQPCRGVSIQVEQLHGLVHEAVEEWAERHPDYAKASAGRADVSAERAELTAEQGRARVRLADVMDKADEGLITPDRAAAMEARWIGRIREIEAQLAELRVVASEPPLPAVIEWDEMSPGEHRRMVAEALVTPITVAPGTGGARPLSPVERVALTVR